MTPPGPPGTDTTRRALVVFSGRTDMGWLRLLKPGFRHCFLVIEDDLGWILYDPLSNRTEIEFAPLPPACDIAEWYYAHGLRVVEAVRKPPPKRAAPWRPFTCVEAVKRALGIHDRWILTPRQLYRHLVRERRKRGSRASP